MKIGCLQFAPELGQTERNIELADRILAQTRTEGLDLLVLPELAFTGYNFASLTAIEPHLEPTAAGVSTQWAQRTARRLNCLVSVGYPEIADSCPVPSTEYAVNSEISAQLSPTHSNVLATVAVVPNLYGPPNFNSSVTVSPTGQILVHYRKSFLYYTDTTWARPGTGFHEGYLPLRTMKPHTTADNHEHEYNEIKIAGGICMDLNPHNFTAPWQAYEFANHVLSTDASVVIVNMAWLSHDLAPEDLIPGSSGSQEPDTHTLSYWIERLRPLVERVDKELIAVMANRAGMEAEACYAGTSTIMKLGRGGVGLFGLMGKGEEGVLMVDTSTEPRFMLTKKDGNDKVGEEEEED